MRDTEDERAVGLRQLLNEWDFIGVYDPEVNVDEYDCLIDPLLVQLANGADTEVISRYLHRVIDTHFGMTSTYLGVQTFADRLVSWWDDQASTR